jgi:hypothetical protein
MDFWKRICFWVTAYLGLRFVLLLNINLLRLQVFFMTITLLFHTWTPSELPGP